MKKAIVLILISIMLASIVYSQPFNFDQSVTNPAADTPKPSLYDKILHRRSQTESIKNPPGSGGNQLNPQDNSGNQQGGNNNQGNSQGKGKLGKGERIQDVDAPVGLEKISCEDTDNGLSFAVSGVVSGRIKKGDEEPVTYYDKCRDTNTLIEYYCNPWTGMVKFHQIYCKAGCEDSAGGSRCSANPFCIDTDKENNPNMKGNLILIKANEEDLPEGSIAALSAQNLVEIAQDYCDEADSTKVRQYACDLSEAGYSETVAQCEPEKKCHGGRCRITSEIPEDEADEPSEDSGGFFGGVKNFFGVAKANVADSAIKSGKRKGDTRDDGSIECEEGDKIVVNGAEVSCFADRLVFAMKLNLGYNLALGVNFEEDSAASGSGSLPKDKARR